MSVLQVISVDELKPEAPVQTREDEMHHTPPNYWAYFVLLRIIKKIKIFFDNLLRIIKEIFFRGTFGECRLILFLQ